MLTIAERRARVKLTRENAEQFIQTHRDRAATFTPVGVIQGLDAKDYADRSGNIVKWVIGIWRLAAWSPGRTPKP